jgi:hypothetical protein
MQPIARRRIVQVLRAAADAAVSYADEEEIAVPRLIKRVQRVVDRLSVEKKLSPSLERAMRDAKNIVEDLQEFQEFQQQQEQQWPEDTAPDFDTSDSSQQPTKPTKSKPKSNPLMDHVRNKPTVEPTDVEVEVADEDMEELTPFDDGYAVPEKKETKEEQRARIKKEVDEEDDRKAAKAAKPKPKAPPPKPSPAVKDSKPAHLKHTPLRKPDQKLEPKKKAKGYERKKSAIDEANEAKETNKGPGRFRKTKEQMRSGG